MSSQPGSFGDQVVLQLCPQITLHLVAGRKRRVLHKVLSRQAVQLVLGARISLMLHLRPGAFR